MPTPASAGSDDLSRHPYGKYESGFTLIEMLVALAVFSLAALALLRLEGATAASTVNLRNQAVAQVVARNIVVETLTDPLPPAFGTASGTVTNGGESWRWQRETGRSPEPRIQQIQVAVSSADGREMAGLTVFRRAAQ